jgi:tetratricopeptide (TPR) repeat protein
LCTDQAALGNSEAARRAAGHLLADQQLEAADVNAILPAVQAHDEAVALMLLEGLRSKGLATAEVLAKAAALYENREDFAAARKAYDNLFQASPPSAAILLELARIAWKQKDLEGALGYVAHARDLEPANAQIHYLFGVICNAMQVPLEAKKALERALQLEPDNPHFNYAMGIVTMQYQDKPAALPYLERYVKAKPDDPRGHLALANLYFILYETDKAKRELQPVLGSEQFRVAAEFLLGRLDQQSGDTAGAIMHYTKVMELDPKSAEGHAELGALYLHNEDIAAARRYTEEALKLDDKNYTANRTLLSLYRMAEDSRVTEQSTKLKSLIEDREARSKLLLRTIEVRPY